MKKFVFSLFSIVAFFVSGCSNDEPKDSVKEIAMSVSAQTVIMHSLSNYRVCMLVMSEDDPGQWKALDINAIEGFKYEKGHEYELRVKRTILADPPMDGSNIRCSLVQILMDKLVTEPTVPLDNKEINTETDIKYQDQCPINKYSIGKGNVFVVDGNGNITYADGSRLPSYDKSAQIYLEVNRDNPDWVKYESIPYLATYSYILSPLSDKIRLVRAESSALLFKKVVPEDEFDDIIKKMKSGEDLHYSLILANVYKKGIQKIGFTIKKK